MSVPVAGVVLTVVHAGATDRRCGTMAAMDAVTAREDRFPHFDALRAIAAVSVVLFHAVGFWGGGLADGAAGRAFIARLEVGVPVFLAISGFLLYRPFVAAHAAGRARPATGAYAWRRFLRIVPAYWVALTLSAVALSWTYVFDGADWLTYYGFGQLYTVPALGRGAIAPAWTLGIEVSFYAFLPLWAAGLRAPDRRGPDRSRDQILRRHATAVGGLWVASVLYSVVLFATGAVADPVRTNDPALLALPGTLDTFALGMALAVASVALQGRPLPRLLAAIERRSWLPWALALTAFCASAVAIGLTGAPDQAVSPAQYLAKWQLYGLVAVGLLWPAVFGDQRRGAVRRLLGLAPLAWVGLVSYGVYVWHWPVLMQLQRWDLGAAGVHPYVLWGVTGLLATLVLGALSYAVVERPALSLRRFVGPGRTRQPTKPSGTASDSKVRMQ
ncbi:MAG: acyltransferase [Solirubrobacterales bacterium]|nr:acyltransferase [Solirubrobacterales bacterium]